MPSENSIYTFQICLRPLMWSRAFCGRRSKRRTKTLPWKQLEALLEPNPSISLELVWKQKFITRGPAARPAFPKEHSRERHDSRETPTMSIRNICIHARKHSSLQPGTTGCFWQAPFCSFRALMWCMLPSENRYYTLRRNSVSKQIFHICDTCTALMQISGVTLNQLSVPPPRPRPRWTARWICRLWVTAGEPDGWNRNDFRHSGASVTLPEAPHVHRAALAHDKTWLLVKRSARRSAVHHPSQTVQPAVIVPSLCSHLSGWNSEASQSSAAPSTLLCRPSASCSPSFFILHYHPIMYNLWTRSSICTSPVIHKCPSSPAVSSSSQINAGLNFPSFVSRSSSSCSCLSSSWRFCSSCSSSSTKTR